jgi:thiamine kinase-like enzyme
MDEYNVETLSGGYSDSILLRVKSVGKDAGQVSNVVKLSENQFSLNKELKSKPYQGSILDQFSTLPRQAETIKVQNWYAFSLAEVKNAQTLEAFLQRRKANDRNKAILKRVIKNLLLEPALSAKIIDDGLKDLNLYYVFLSDVISVLESLYEYSRHKKQSLAENIECLIKYLTNLDGANFQLSIHQKYGTFLHGDMHCRNILLNERNEATLIDFARSDIYPRLFDIAALDVDLIINVFDSQKGANWEFNKIAGWSREIKNNYPFKSDSKSDNTCISYARKLMHDYMIRELPDFSDVEYAEVVTFQLLRYLRFHTITFPKKIVCAVWAAELLKKYKKI